MGERFPDDAHDELNLKIYLPYESRRHPTRSSILADAARRADTNHDGIITESEANAFARKRKS